MDVCGGDRCPDALGAGCARLKSWQPEPTHLYSRPGYDPLGDFAPIAYVGVGPLLLAVHPDVTIVTLLNRDSSAVLAKAKGFPNDNA